MSDSFAICACGFEVCEPNPNKPDYCMVCKEKIVWQYVEYGLENF